jgi:hypothetical protein
MMNLALPSPLPQVDAYVAGVLAHLPARAAQGGGIRAYGVTAATAAGTPAVLSYEMQGNRYCWNVGRQHKSNNVRWIVNLDHMTATQLCHDHDCRAVGYVGHQVKIEDEGLREWWREVKFEEELCRQCELLERKMGQGGEGGEGGESPSNNSAMVLTSCSGGSQQTQQTEEAGGAALADDSFERRLLRELDDNPGAWG